MGFISECIYLGIVFTNEHVFCFDHTTMYIKKKKSSKKSVTRIGDKIVHIYLSATPDNYQQNW